MVSLEMRIPTFMTNLLVCFQISGLSSIADGCFDEMLYRLSTVDPVLKEIFRFGAP